ncbi:MAG: hypothetical protein ACUZ8E_07085 [Candidatus Anammoxibacter sp.]
MHEAPTEEIFNEMKQAATEIWQAFDNEFGYVDEKMEIVNRFTNIQDNAMVFCRMFDSVNQGKMMAKLSSEAIEYIRNNP